MQILGSQSFSWEEGLVSFIAWACLQDLGNWIPTSCLAYHTYLLPLTTTRGQQHLYIPFLHPGRTERIKLPKLLSIYILPTRFLVKCGWKEDLPCRLIFSCLIEFRFRSLSLYSVPKGPSQLTSGPVHILSWQFIHGFVTDE